MRGTGCPVCSNRKVAPENSIGSQFPELTREWHPTKNGKLTPFDVSRGSDRKVYWLCRLGHYWPATVSHRVSGTNCPRCKAAASSIELRILSELGWIFGNLVHRAKIGGLECDVYSSRYHFGIEVDAYHWHKNKLKKDVEKTKQLASHGVYLLRLRQQGLSKISSHDIEYAPSQIKKVLINKILRQLESKMDFSNAIKSKIEKYCQETTFLRDRQYGTLLKLLPGPMPGKSLADKFPGIAKEWHPKRNGRLKPSEISYGTDREFWWKCGKGHSWPARVLNRINGQGCAVCAGKRVIRKTSLGYLYPKLLKEWDYSKNKISPFEVAPGSEKKVFWLCLRNGDSWPATIVNRVKGTGCPICAGKKVVPGNSLADLFPEIAKQWHPTLNKSLSPADVRPKSNRRVWWLCEKKHEWPSTVSNRVGGKKCSVCSNRRADKTNSLSVLFPEVAKEWHPTENRDLTPDDVVPGSGKKVWWKCVRGHSWPAVIRNRTKRGHKCPNCPRTKKSSVVSAAP